MIKQKLIRLIILLAWLGGIGNTWAQVSQSGENAYVKFLTSSQGFNIQFKINGTGDWQKTTWNNGGYKTVVKINDGAQQSICSSDFQFGQVYTVGGIQVSIEASIADATTRAVTVQYNIKNTNGYAVQLQIGSWADTQVGSDDHATITREGHNTIMMTASGGAMYGITAGTDPFTTLWYGYYGSASSNVFNDNGGVYDYGTSGSSTDSGLAWSWTINSIPAGGTKIIAFGGLASQKGAVSMAGYKYGTIPSTPSVSGITGNPSITYYYNTTNSNSGGTVWSGITGTTLNAGVYYMYANIAATSTSAAMTTPTTPFTVAKADYDMSGISFANGSFSYNGEAHSLAISGTLPSGVSVSYVNNSRTNTGYQTVTANFATTNSNYNVPASKTATLTVNKVTPQATDFAYTAPTPLVYNGSPKTATVVTNLSGNKTGMGAVTVKYYSGTTELSSAPKNAGTYTVKIDVTEGTNYTAATNITDASWTFTIGTKGITNSSISVFVAAATYTATAQTPIVTVMDGTKVLAVGSDYSITLSETSYTDATTYTSAITVTGIGNYSGTRYENYVISKLAITSTAITVDDLNYNGNPQETKPQITIKYGENLIPVANYTVTPTSVTEAGTYTLTITGANNLTGSTAVKLKMKKTIIMQ